MLFFLEFGLRPLFDLNMLGHMLDAPGLCWASHEEVQSNLVGTANGRAISICSFEGPGLLGVSGCHLPATEAP